MKTEHDLDRIKDNEKSDGINWGPACGVFVEGTKFVREVGFDSVIVRDEKTRYIMLIDGVVPETIFCDENGDIFAFIAKPIRSDAIHLNQAGFELLLESAEEVFEISQAEEFLKWRASRPDMEYLKELDDYAEGKWVSEQLSHYKQFGEFEDMYDGWRFEAWVARGKMIGD